MKKTVLIAAMIASGMVAAASAAAAQVQDQMSPGDYQPRTETYDRDLRDQIFVREWNTPPKEKTPAPAEQKTGTPPADAENPPVADQTIEPVTPEGTAPLPASPAVPDAATPQLHPLDDGAAAPAPKSFRELAR